MSLNTQCQREPTAGKLSWDLAAANGIIFSRQTAYRRIAEKGLHGIGGMSCTQHIAGESPFFIEPGIPFFVTASWAHVLFPDESRFSI
ncbi:hypothetical protein AVEN_89557-1 [Araneus ventricosus]|uniref:Uncharacterized protein n=1 Tax=Araneus ventricosus TaxID=182803 RepID=A0A4Y2X2A7_ARAVE|nr:hypothetical protein AVEN_89557-1 [Araneus ventricosus]